MKIIINEPETKKKDFKTLYKDFGRWDDINNRFKNDHSLLDMIFAERAAKTSGGCKYCSTLYINYTHIHGTKGYRCKCQKSKVFPLKGTHFENYKKSLNLVIKVIYEMTTNKNGISSLSVLRRETINEKSANLLTRRISDWMHWYLMQQEFTPGSIIEIDEVYPKFNTDLGDYYPWKSGSGSERTHGVLVLCQRDGLSLAIAYDKRKGGEVMRLIKKHVPVENNNIIFTDESTLYTTLLSKGYCHRWTTHSENNFGSDGGVNSNLAENLNTTIKKTLQFTHKGVYEEYLQLYMSRYAFIHCIRKDKFEECIMKLIKSLPALNKGVTVNYKSLKNNYRNAA